MEKLRDVDAALRAEYGLRRRMLIERAQVLVLCPIQHAGVLQPLP